MSRQTNLRVALKHPNRLFLRRVEIAGLFVALVLLSVADVIGLECRSVAPLIAAVVIVMDGATIILRYRQGTPA